MSTRGNCPLCPQVFTGNRRQEVPPCYFLFLLCNQPSDMKSLFRVIEGATLFPLCGISPLVCRNMLHSGSCRTLNRKWQDRGFRGSSVSEQARCSVCQGCSDVLPPVFCPPADGEALCHHSFVLITLFCFSWFRSALQQKEGEN